MLTEVTNLLSNHRMVVQLNLFEATLIMGIVTRVRVQSRHSQNLGYSETWILKYKSIAYESQTDITLDWE